MKTCSLCRKIWCSYPLKGSKFLGRPREFTKQRSMNPRKARVEFTWKQRHLSSRPGNNHHVTKRENNIRYCVHEETELCVFCYRGHDKKWSLSVNTGLAFRVLWKHAVPSRTFLPSNLISYKGTIYIGLENVWAGSACLMAHLLFLITQFTKY